MIIVPVRLIIPAVPKSPSRVGTPFIALLDQRIVRNSATNQDYVKFNRYEYAVLVIVIRSNAYRSNLLSKHVGFYYRCHSGERGIIEITVVELGPVVDITQDPDSTPATCAAPVHQQRWIMSIRWMLSKVSFGGEDQGASSI